MDLGSRVAQREREKKERELDKEGGGERDFCTACLPCTPVPAPACMSAYLLICEFVSECTSHFDLSSSSSSRGHRYAWIFLSLSLSLVFLNLQKINLGLLYRIKREGVLCSELRLWFDFRGQVRLLMLWALEGWLQEGQIQEREMDRRCVLSAHSSTLTLKADLLWICNITLPPLCIVQKECFKSPWAFALSQVC